MGQYLVPAPLNPFIWIRLPQVHPSDMGSAVSFVPQQPWLILALSKRGETVLQDIRMMGQPLLKQQLEGPVYDMAWTVTDVLDSGSNGVDAAAAGGCVSELMLNVVGCDEYIRRYPFNRAALQAGRSKINRYSLTGV